MATGRVNSFFLNNSVHVKKWLYLQMKCLRHVHVQLQVVEKYHVTIAIVNFHVFTALCCCSTESAIFLFVRFFNPILRILILFSSKKWTELW